jgi:hypothetical protein
MDGFYLAYLTGKAGSSIAVFIIRENVIVGLDAAGMSYDGTIEPKSDGSGFVCKVVYVVPAGVPLLTGASPLAEPHRVPLTFELPTDFDGKVVLVVTPLGPVNVKFQKARGI